MMLLLTLLALTQPDAAGADAAGAMQPDAADADAAASLQPDAA